MVILGSGTAHVNPFRALRRRRRPLVVQTLAMIGVVWLNMVLQPCLMAAEMDVDMSRPCPHCPAPMSDDCDGAASNVCTYFDSVDYDGRSPLAKAAKKVHDTFLALAASPVERPYPASTSATGPPPAAEARPPAVPINVLHCVYLN